MIPKIVILAPSVFLILVGLATPAIAEGNSSFRERNHTSEDVSTCGRGDCKEAIPIRGVYFHDGFDFEPHEQAPLYWTYEDWEKEVRWLKACGLNTIEFATMLEWLRIPSTDLERRKITERRRLMDLIHELGMKFSYILSTNVVSMVPPNEPPGHQLQGRARKVCPLNADDFEVTIAISRYFIEQFRDADFFEVFAGDWGGCNCGKCGTRQYLQYVARLSEIIRSANPDAEVFANTWAIYEWGPPLNVMERLAWDREISGSREVIAALCDLPGYVNVTLPSHHLYRPLTFSLYQNKGVTECPEFPTYADVETIHAAGRKVWAWPHFLLDDDPFRPQSWGLVHSEVRYIRQLIQKLVQLGVDGVIANLYLPRRQILNTYAYGRLLADPELEPITILHEFAQVVAHPEDVDLLTEVLIWLENNSFWQQQMPPDRRLPNLPLRTLTRLEVIEQLDRIRPNPEPHLPIPESPERWLKDLRSSIQRMEW